MTPTELLAANLTRNLEMMKGTLADFSDADMLVRPVPGANHAMWQLGHCLSVETAGLHALTPDLVPPLPDGIAPKFAKETAKVDDPAAFSTKAELLALYAKPRAGAAQWVKGLTEADLNKPAPERFARMAPTLGSFILLLPTHLMMHVGQFQVIRRKLGKAILF